MDREMRRGITVIELIVVIAIVGVMLGLAGLMYRDWRIKWSIEADTKDIYAFVQKARVIAFTRKISLSVIANGRQTCINIGGVDTDCINTDNTFSGTIVITDRGVFNNSRIVYKGGASLDVAYSCVVSVTTRVRMGVFDGTTCNPK